MQRCDLAAPQFSFHKFVEWNEWGPICVPRLETAAKLPIRRLPQVEPHEGRAIIVGAGPTAAKHLDSIKQLAAGPLSTVFSVNAAHDWLIKREVIPNIHVLFEDDVDEVSVAIGGMPHSDTVYFLCSHCHPNLFRDLEGHSRVLWHAATPIERYQSEINRLFPGEFMVGGGHATFFRVLTIAMILGYREFDLFGIDSSFEGSSHLDNYTLADIEPRINIWGRDPRSDKLRQFTSQGGLAYQAVEFLDFCKQHHDKMKLRVYGDSLLRYIHESCYPEQYQFLGKE